MWTLLLLTLPAQPAAVRLRVWRNLKAMGSGALRDGAYVLPAPHSTAFTKVAEEVTEHGGTAFLADLIPKSPEQEQELAALFDRTESYTQWRDTLPALRKDIEAVPEGDARRRFRSTSEALQAIERIDFFPSEARDQANTELALLRRDIDARFATDEPLAHPGDVPAQSLKNFQNKRWATRARPWVDRLACAWLIGRFIDKQPTFVWLKDIAKVPRGAIGYDFDGAQFTHIGSLVSFEVMATSFGLHEDPRLRRIGAIVHFLDVGGMPVSEAAGLECVLSGLRDMHADDDALIEASNVIFDALYATPIQQPSSRRG